ncbi:hypothetical protein LINGRAHAP2_LOCUS11473, partial [Linum grandiflorum]
TDFRIELLSKKPRERILTNRERRKADFGASRVNNTQSEQGFQPRLARNQIRS